MIVVVESLSLAAVFIHLALLVWFHERYSGEAIWPVMAAVCLVPVSALGFSAITGGAAAPGLWLAWQAAVLVVGIRLYVTRRSHRGPAPPEQD